MTHAQNILNLKIGYNKGPRALTLPGLEINMVEGKKAEAAAAGDRWFESQTEIDRREHRGLTERRREK